MGVRFLLAALAAALLPVAQAQTAAAPVQSTFGPITVWAKPTGNLNEYGGAFILGVANGGQTPLPLSLSAISAKSGDTPLHVITHDELVLGLNLLNGILFGVFDAKAVKTRKANPSEPDRTFSLKTPEGLRIGWCGAKDDKTCTAGWRLIQVGVSSFKKPDDRTLKQQGDVLKATGVLAEQQMIQSGEIPPGVQAGGLLLVERPADSDKIHLEVTLAGHVHALDVTAAPAP